MSRHLFDSLGEPVSPDAPCGSDLEAEGDAEFLRFQAQIDGVLPASFFSFDRKDAALGGHIAAATALLRRTADLRVAAALAKLAILDGDLAGFTSCLTTVAAWLSERWDHLHPGLLDGDPVLRLVELRSLDDNPHTVLPLQSAPLFKSRRLGAVSLRSYLLADGTVKPRAGFGDEDSSERVPSAGDLASAIKEADLAGIIAMRDCARQLVVAIESIEVSVGARAGAAGAVRLNALKAQAVLLASTLDKAAVIKDPTLALAEPEHVPIEGDNSGSELPASAGSSGLVNSTRAMLQALRASAAYFASHEPSSPIRMLLAQAEALVGKSFFDALSALAPEIASQATIRPARQLSLALPIERLAQLMPEANAGTDFASTPDSDQGAWDQNSSEAERELAAASVTAGHHDDEGDLGGPRTFTAATRQDALILLEEVSAFLRRTEPSSPIPFILDHVRSMVGRDFLGLLRELLPPNLLAVDEE